MVIFNSYVSHYQRVGDPTSQGSTRFAQIHTVSRPAAMNDLHHMFKETTVYKQLLNPTRLYVNNP